MAPIDVKIANIDVKIAIFLAKLANIDVKIAIFLAKMTVFFNDPVLTENMKINNFCYTF